MSVSKLYLLSIAPLFPLYSLRAADAQPKPHSWQRKTFETACTIAGGYAGFKKAGIRGVALGAPGGYVSAKVAESFYDDFVEMRANAERVQANEKRARILHLVTTNDGKLHPDFAKLLSNNVNQQLILSALSANDPCPDTPTERVCDFISHAVTDEQGDLDPNLLPDEDDLANRASPFMDRLITLICSQKKYREQLRTALNAREEKDEEDHEKDGEMPS